MIIGHLIDPISSNIIDPISSIVIEPVISNILNIMIDLAFTILNNSQDVLDNYNGV